MFLKPEDIPHLQAEEIEVELKLRKIPLNDANAITQLRHNLELEFLQPALRVFKSHNSKNPGLELQACQKAVVLFSNELAIPALDDVQNTKLLAQVRHWMGRAQRLVQCSPSQSQPAQETLRCFESYHQQLKARAKGKLDISLNTAVEEALSNTDGAGVMMEPPPSIVLEDEEPILRQPPRSVETLQGTSTEIRGNTSVYHSDNTLPTAVSYANEVRRQSTVSATFIP